MKRHFSCSELVFHFNSAIPVLVLVDEKDEIISLDARSMISNDVEGQVRKTDYSKTSVKLVITRAVPNVRFRPE